MSARILNLIVRSVVSFVPVKIVKEATLIADGHFLARSSPIVPLRSPLLESGATDWDSNHQPFALKRMFRVD